MRYSKLFIIVVTFLALVPSCRNSDSGDVVGPVPSGAFAYISYDSMGTAIVQGWFTIIIKDSSTVTGEWHFRRIGEPKNIGPQVGDGNLVGGFDAPLLSVELNPQFVDNNLNLRGTIDDGTYNGTWMAIGYPGVTNKGTFRSSRK